MPKDLQGDFDHVLIGFTLNFARSLSKSELRGKVDSSAGQWARILKKVTQVPKICI